ncbi:MAG TPA: response regulator [Paenibacillus sp.]|nr:response regulator [Paenibacillus sp.]
MFKVWIVDDEPMVTEGLKRQVHWETYNMELVGAASDGQAVLDGLAAQPADLLITDISMPQMDGLTLITKAKRLYPSIRCVIISAYNEFDYVKKALQLGVENYLLKPINEGELHDTLSKTMENLLRDSVALAQHSPDVMAFRSNVLARWANGTIQDFELNERAELLHIELSAPAYSVFVLELLDPADPQAKVQHASQLLELSRAALPQPVECFMDGSLRVVAIVPQEDGASRREASKTALRRIGEESAARGLPVFAAFGPPIRGAANLRDSYAAAELALYYRFLDPAAASVDGEPFFDRAAERRNEMQADLASFDTALREGSLPQALQAVDKALARAAGEAEKRAAAVPLALALVRAAVESGRMTDALPPEMVGRLADFAKLPAHGSVRDWLVSLVQQAAKAIQERKGSYHLLIRRTLEQVNRNYGAELSLKTLATSLGVSSAYLGQLFREETGKYFNDYLTEVRMKAASSLLLETELKINEIVTRVGIPNQSYFNRIFKKLYGVSPVEYRRQGLAHPG